MTYRTQPAGRIGFAAPSGSARRVVAGWPLTAAAAAVAAALAFGAADASALALGRVKVLSALGEPLRAEIDIPEISTAETESLRAGPASPETFRAAGLEFDSVVSSVRVAVQRRADGRPFLRLSSSRPVNDPFLDLIVNVSSSSGQVSRDFTMLFDPQGGRGSAPTVIPPAAQSVARADAVAAVAKNRSASRASINADAAATGNDPAGDAPAASSRRVRTGAAAAPRVSRAVAAPAGDDANRIKVRPGDTAGKIAAANLPADVSLDQMLAAMLRANPAAFVNGNINRMRAGVVLDMPNAAQLAEQAGSQAQATLHAQSKDFNGYRRKLAAAAAPAQGAAADRADSGKLQAAVQESNPASAAPDKLTLSKGSLDRQAPAAVATSPAAAAPTASAAPDSNLNAPTGPATTPGAGNATAPGSGSNATVPATTAAAAPSTAAPSTPAAGGDMPGAAGATATRTAAPASGTLPNTAAAGGAGKTADGVLGARAKPAAQPAEPGLIDQMLDQPALPAAGLGLLAFLAGFGIWRSRRAKRAENADKAETGTESMFSMSGGRSIDTLHGSDGVASIAYSPSQLDTGGEVDPVAEADVYLAYGREEQALEILKEAMRNTPKRADVRVKLLEVHARRREVKAFEALAKDTRAIVGSDSREWRHICEIGRELDFQNSLYQAPISAAVPLQADITTSAMPTAQAPITQSQRLGSLAGVAGATVAAADAPAPRQAPESFDLDLDFGSLKPAPVAAPPSVPAALAGSVTQPVELDLDLSDFGSLEPSPATKARRPEAHQTTPSRLAQADSSSHKPAFAATDLGQMRAMPQTTAPSTGMIDFDFSSLRLDLDDAPPASAASKAESASVITAPLTKPDQSVLPDRKQAVQDAPSHPVSGTAADDSDSLSTKLALAEAFSAIGDVDGARSLAHEVIGESSGTLKAKAQRFLASID